MRDFLRSKDGSLPYLKEVIAGGCVSWRICRSISWLSDIEISSLFSSCTLKCDQIPLQYCVSTGQVNFDPRLLGRPSIKDQVAFLCTFQWLFIKNSPPSIPLTLREACVRSCSLTHWRLWKSDSRCLGRWLKQLSLGLSRSSESLGSWASTRYAWCVFGWGGRAYWVGVVEMWGTCLYKCSHDVWVGPWVCVSEATYRWH